MSSDISWSYCDFMILNTFLTLHFFKPKSYAQAFEVVKTGEIFYLSKYGNFII